MKFIFSYQEKILRCSIVTFHNSKRTFKNNAILCVITSMNDARMLCVKTSSIKTTFSYEKKRISLGKTRVLN